MRHLRIILKSKRLAHHIFMALQRAKNIQKWRLLKVLICTDFTEESPLKITI